MPQDQFLCQATAASYGLKLTEGKWKVLGIKPGLDDTLWRHHVAEVAGPSVVEVIVAGNCERHQAETGANGGTRIGAQLRNDVPRPPRSGYFGLEGEVRG